MYQSKITGRLHGGKPPPPRNFAGMPPEFAVQSTRLRMPDEVVADPEHQRPRRWGEARLPSLRICMAKDHCNRRLGRLVPDGPVVAACHRCYKRRLVEVHGASRWVDPLREPGPAEAAAVRAILADVIDNISLGLFGDGRVEMLASAWPKLWITYYSPRLVADAP